MSKKWTIEDFELAWTFATLAHRDQTYGGASPDEKIPYINHVASVAAELISLFRVDEGYDERLAISCALLHDVLEDTATTYAEIERLFGVEIAQGVLALTKDSAIVDKTEKMRDSLARIKKMPKEVWLGKLADRICNLFSAPFYWDEQKKKSYQEEARYILSELGEANPMLAQRLNMKIDRYV